MLKVRKKRAGEDPKEMRRAVTEGDEGQKKGDEGVVIRELREGDMEVEMMNHHREETRLPFKEVDQNAMQETSVKIEENRNGVRSSWKRLTVGERKESVQNAEHNKKNMRGYRMKRAISVEESEDIKEWRDYSSIRNKVQKISLTTISPIVEVTSQEWPKIDI